MTSSTINRVTFGADGSCQGLVDCGLRMARIGPMRASSPWVLAAFFLAGMMSFSLQADYLKNTDFSEGSQCWRGDGQAAFLNADGTEGNEGDPGVTPVIKVTLSSGHPHFVFQEFSPQDAPAALHFKVQVYASVDFARSTHASDYQLDDDYWSMPTADFVVRLMPNYYQRPFGLKPGEWVTIQGESSFPRPADDRAIYFFFPPGTGVVYIKNPSVTP